MTLGLQVGFLLLLNMCLFSFYVNVYLHVCMHMCNMCMSGAHEDQKRVSAPHITKVIEKL